MREEGLKEVYVDGALRPIEDTPSTPALAAYLASAGVVLQPGWRVEINLRAVEWMRDAARRLRRGFIIVIDYGHEARELYSPTHAAGTLTSYSSHRSAGPDSAAARPPWLESPGERDITSHVDFTSVRAAAESEGLQTLGFLDQTYFLLGLLGSLGSRFANLEHPANLANPNLPNPNLANSANLPNPANPANPANLANLETRLALKTLIMPGGLGSTQKVLIFGKGVGTPALLGCSYRMRVT